MSIILRHEISGVVHLFSKGVCWTRREGNTQKHSKFWPVCLIHQQKYRLKLLASPLPSHQHTLKGTREQWECGCGAWMCVRMGNTHTLSPLSSLHDHHCRRCHRWHHSRHSLHSTLSITHVSIPLTVTTVNHCHHATVTTDCACHHFHQPILCFVVFQGADEMIMARLQNARNDSAIFAQQALGNLFVALQSQLETFVRQV